MRGDRGGALAGRLAAGVALAVIVGACSSAGTSPSAGGPSATPASTPASSAAASTPASAATPAGSISSLAIDATFEQTLPYFAYDTTLPLDIKDAAEARTQDGVTIRDITYAATSDSRVPAYLVTPAGNGPFAAVIFIHGEGSAGGLTRDEFLNEATRLAAKGVVSLLTTRYFPHSKVPEDWRTDRQSIVDQVVQLRRGLDVLAAQPGVDARRIGFVGDDYGGMSGAILAAVDRRVKTAVFMSFVPAWADWFFITYPFDESIRPEYRKAMTALDPATAIAQVAPTPVLLQYGENYGFIDATMKETSTKAAHGARTIVYPNTGWDMDVPEAYADRSNWLTEHLAIAS
jgi:hypothetical protein